MLEFAIILFSMVLTFWGQHVYHNTATGILSTVLSVNLGFLHAIKLFTDTSNNIVTPLILIAIVFTQLIGLIIYKIITMTKSCNKLKVCCVGTGNRNDDWDDYEQIELQRQMEFEDDEGDDACASIESIPTY